MDVEVIELIIKAILAEDISRATDDVLLSLKRGCKVYLGFL